PLKQARAGQNTSQAVYGSDCLRSVEPGYQGAISAAFSKREKQNAGAWCRNAQAGANLLWCCKTSEPIPPTSSRLSCCERFGEMVSTQGLYNAIATKMSLLHRVSTTLSRQKCRSYKHLPSPVKRLPTTIGKHLAFIQQSRSLP